MTQHDNYLWDGFYSCTLARHALCREASFSQPRVCHVGCDAVFRLMQPQNIRPLGWLRRGYDLSGVAICHVLPQGSRTMQRRSPYGVSNGASTVCAPDCIARSYIESASGT